MKKLIVLIVLAVLMLTACGPQVEEIASPVAPTDAPVVVEPTLRDLQGGKPFVYVGNALEHPTIKLMMLGFWDACQDYAVDCEFYVDPGYNEADLIAAAERAIARGVSGMDNSGYVSYWPINMVAKEAGIPVVGQHANLTDITEAEKAQTGLIAWVAPDPILYGGDVATVMAEQLDCGSPVIVTQSSFNTTEDAAAKGFRDKYAELCPEAVILDVQQEGLEPVEAINKVSAVIMANPELKGAFGTTGGSINAWGKALQQAGKNPGDVLVIGMDATTENIDMVRSGWVYALVDQPVYTENYKAVEILIANMKGEAFDWGNPMPSPIITADGLDALEALAGRSQTDLPK